MKTIAEKRPELRVEWDSAKNLGLSFDRIAASSKKRAWWKCQKDHRHKWLAQIRDRATGHGCPYCSGRFTLREESFGVKFPELVKQLHPNRNQGFDPYATAPLSNKEVTWICTKNKKHEWKTRLSGRTSVDAGCPHCRAEASSLAAVAPNLAAEWHPTLNSPQTPSTVSAGSRHKVWWQCQQNAKHVWPAQIRMRVDAKTGCPICLKRRGAKKQPTISEFSPELAAQWHPTKNGALGPRDFTIGSNSSAWWKCPAGPDHEWPAPIRNRAKLGHGCPMCSNRTGRASKGKSLADKHPKLASQWDFEKNGTLRPEQFTPGSTRRVWWKCSGSPAHHWESTIYNRTSGQPDGECPFCSKNRLEDTNTLRAVFPQIALEWHPTKNGSETPDTVSRASGKKVWWQCQRDPTHEWQATVKNRTVHKSGCRECDAEQRSERLKLSILESIQLHADCLKTLRHNLKNLRELVQASRVKSVHLHQALFRMIYSSAITALETFLSDSFYQQVIPDQTRMEKLLSTAPEFTDRKYSISEVVNWSQNLKKKVGEYLYDIVWHNIWKGKMMYSTVLGVEYPADLAPIMKAVAIRHDIVHRNGRNKNNGLHTFKTEELNRLFVLVEDFAAHIHNQIVSLATDQSKVAGSA